MDILRLDWPPYSPDLNPIEKIWHVLKTRLQHHTFDNVKDLIKQVNHIWDVEIE